jgi:hypothetical protein
MRLGFIGHRFGVMALGDAATLVLAAGTHGQRMASAVRLPEFVDARAGHRLSDPVAQPIEILARHQSRSRRCIGARLGFAGPAEHGSVLQAPRSTARFCRARGARLGFAGPAEHGSVLQAPRSTLAVVQTGWFWAELLREGALFAFGYADPGPGAGGPGLRAGTRGRGKRDDGIGSVNGHAHLWRPDPGLRSQK